MDPHSWPPTAGDRITLAPCLLVHAKAAKNWIWTGGGENLKPDEQKRRFEEFRQAGIHAVLFSGYNAQVLARAKEAGLETHAWIWTLCRGEKQLLIDHPA